MRLLSPFKLGACELRNRMLLAPLTRCRAGVGYVPQEMGHDQNLMWLRGAREAIAINF